MVNREQLREICDKYGLDSKKIIKFYRGEVGHKNESFKRSINLSLKILFFIFLFQLHLAKYHIVSGILL